MQNFWEKDKILNFFQILRLILETHDMILLQITNFENFYATPKIFQKENPPKLLALLMYAKIEKKTLEIPLYFMFPPVSALSDVVTFCRKKKYRPKKRRRGNHLFTFRDILITSLFLIDIGEESMSVGLCCCGVVLLLLRSSTSIASQ